MDTFAHIMGWIVLGLGVAGLVIALLSFLVERLARFGDYLQARGEENARNRLSLELRSQSYWFGEDETTTWLFQATADRIEAGYGDGLSGLRDEWRKRREKGPKP